MTFEQTGLIDPLLRAISEEGYHTPTPIQKQTIPKILSRKDILGCAQTGTGKTAAFALPILQMIQQKDIPGQDKPVLRSLIITPTRELAIQINESFATYGKYTDIKHAVIFGGVNQAQQVEQLAKGVNILVATPGRLLDLMQQGYISLADIRLFVLDEADRMLDMGFIHDVRKVIAELPKKRQSLFFSATMPTNVRKLANTILTQPAEVSVTPVSSTADTVEQQLYYTNKRDKQRLLIHILKSQQIDHALIFARTKHGSDRLSKTLNKNGIQAASIHGDKAQNTRQKALGRFKDRSIKVLVATDIASRGIDIDKLTHVINYEIPNEPEIYVHRIGRSGRAGEEGLAISLCEPEENAYVTDIQKLIKKNIPVVQDHPFPQTDKPMTPEEKKEWLKEKAERRREFFENRRQKKKEKNKSNGQRTPAKSKPKRKPKPQTAQQRSKPKQEDSPKSTQRAQSKKQSANGRKKNKPKVKAGPNSTRYATMPDAIKKKLMWPLD